MKYLHSQSFVLIALAIQVFAGSLFCQNNEIDSLENYISSISNDSLKVDALNSLSVSYTSTDLEKTISTAQNAATLAREINYRRGLGYALKNTGLGYYYLGDYVEAVTIWQEALKIFERIEDKVGVANILSNIGAIYFTEGDYQKALEYLLQSLKVAEETKDTLRMITALGNIGAAYNDRDATHEKALEYSKRALELAEAVKNPSFQINNAKATSAVNIGEVYLNRKESEEALKYYNKALETMEEPDGRIFVMVSIAKAYRQMGNHEEAMAILKDALKLSQEYNLVLNESYAVLTMAQVYADLGQKDKAIGYHKMAVKKSEEINAIKELEDAYLGLQRLYSEMEDFDSAYKYQAKLLDIKQKIYNSETESLLSNQMFDFQIQKKQDEINLKNKDLEIAALDIRKQKVINGLVGAGMLSVAVFLFIALSQKRRISKEKQRSESLLLNILPFEVAEELKEKGESEAKHYEMATVLFTDFKGFTGLSQTVTPAELVEVLNYYFKGFDHIITKYKIEKIKTIGDAYMAVGGLPVPQPDALKKVIMAGLEMQELVKKTQAGSDQPHASKFSMRLGIHTGPVVAGIVGVKKFQYDIWGDTVNTAARMESSGEIGRVNISGDTYERIKDMPEFEFEYRGKVEAKGKGMMEMYFVSLKKDALVEA